CGAAEGLFASRRGGHINGSGGERVEPRTHAWKPVAPPPADESTKKARAILETSKVRDGYCVVWGAGRLAAELARQSDLHVVAIDLDPGRVQALRERLTAHDLSLS